MPKPTNKIYGDCEGPLGLPMRDGMAKDVAAIIADLPANCKELIQDGPMRVVKVAASMDFKDEERADISFITTDAVDRDFEVMLPKGGDFSQFRKNPVVTWAHKYDQLPVGRSLWLKREIKGSIDGWLAKTQYIIRPPDWGSSPWFADAVWHMVRSGSLPGKSIGFIPLQVRGPEEREIAARPALAGVKFIIAKWLVLEYAVAPVQSNPDAVVVATAKARQKGINIPDTMLDDMGLVLPEEMPSNFEPTDSFKERIAKAPTLQEARVALAASVKKSISAIDISALVKETVRSLQGKV